MSELCALAEKYGVDKCPKIFHTYTPEYHAILHPYRNSFSKFVEIGIGNVPLMRPIVGESYKPGASLRMWRDYFSDCQIIGCDIIPETIFNDEERINTYIVDQSNEDSLRTFGEQIDLCDVILDDGSHIKSHMILSFKTLWKFVKSGGFYIIEDIKRHDLCEFEQLSTVLGFNDAKLIKTHDGKNDWDSLVIFQKCVTD
jgi:hypothetical protein